LSIRGNRFYLQAFGVGILFISLIVLMWITFRPSTDVNAQRNVPGTKTALALTQQFLLGPFPTGTRPTPTASKTPTATPTVTLTPTTTLTPTAIRYFIDTLAPRTRAPSFNPVSPFIPTSTAQAVINTPIPVQPTNTSGPPIQPTNPPPTSPPQPTSPPPTSAPQPTSPPPPAQPTPCLNPQGQPIPCH